MSGEGRRPGFFDGFGGPDDVWGNFDVAPCGEILAAWYDLTSYSYEGAATVLFRHDGVLCEVYGSHCSCSGLEGQWRPEPVQRDELLARAARHVAAEPAGSDAAAFWAYVAGAVS